MRQARREAGVEHLTQDLGLHRFTARSFAPRGASQMLLDDAAQGPDFGHYFGRNDFGGTGHGDIRRLKLRRRPGG